MFQVFHLCSLLVGLCIYHAAGLVFCQNTLVVFSLFFLFLSLGSFLEVDQVSVNKTTFAKVHFYT